MYAHAQAMLKTAEGADRFVGKRFYPNGEGGEAPPVVTLEVRMCVCALVGGIAGVFLLHDCWITCR